jgi:hypothetical protein
VTAGTEKEEINFKSFIYVPGNTIISTVYQCNNGTRYYAGLQNKSTFNFKYFLDARVSVPVTFITSSTLKREVIICKLSLAFLHKINRRN